MGMLLCDFEKRVQLDLILLCSGVFAIIYDFGDSTLKIPLKEHPKIFTINLFIDIIDNLHEYLLKEGILTLFEIILFIIESNNLVVD